MTLNRITLLLILLAGSTALSACDTREEDTPVGLYEARLFEAEIKGETVNVLAAGGQLEMALRTNGTADGRILVPAELDEGEETEIRFDGTYTVSGERVTFDHEADTFVRDAAWTYDDGRLEAQTGEVTVVLVRQGLH